MKLYELTTSYNEILNRIEEGDENLYLKDTLEAIEEAIEDKAENVAKLIKTLEADCKVIKEEEKRLADKRKSIEGKITHLKTYLQEQLEVAGLDKVKRPTITVSIQNNPPSVKVTDEKLLSAYMVPQDPKLDKKTLLADLKQGKEIAGAELVQGKGVRIR